MDPAPSGNRILIRLTAVGVVFSAATAAATFSGLASEVTFLRYPLLAAAMATVVLAGWSTGRLPAFNRMLWTHAPWWARLLWFAIVVAVLAAFASISVVETLPVNSGAGEVLETRGVTAIAAYLFLIAGLRRNVDESLSTAEPFDDGNAVEAEGHRTERPPDGKAAG